MGEPDVTVRSLGRSRRRRSRPTRQLPRRHDIIHFTLDDDDTIDVRQYFDHGSSVVIVGPARDTHLDRLRAALAADHSTAVDPAAQLVALRSAVDYARVNGRDITYRTLLDVLDRAIGATRHRSVD